jgi:TrmH family RNA methyltransferase
VLVAEALAARVELRALYVEPGADAALVDRVARGGVPVHRVHEGVLSKALDLVNPQPLVGVAAQFHHGLDPVLQSAASRRRSVLVLVGIQDPGNAGTLVRVAEGAGCAGVVLSAGSVDLFNPKTVRASAGALFRVPVVRSAEWGEVLAAAAAAGLSTLASVAVGGSAPEDVALGGAVAIFLGSEAHGLPSELVEHVNRKVTIPMEGEVESLNAAVAGAVLAFEGARQRRAVTSGG